MTIFGVDIARYQAGLDLSRVRAEGFEFCVAKIGQGAGSGDRRYGPSIDPEWPRFRDSGRRVFGDLFAGYWYVGDDESPASQADRCRAAIGDPSIPIMLDHEDASGTYRNALAVRDAMRATGLRVRLLYLPRWYWQRIGSPSMVDAGMALVSSRYPSTRQDYASRLYQNVTASHWSGYGGLTPTILQFASTGLVAGRVVDVNAFEGSVEQLRAVFGARIVVQDKGNTVVVPTEEDDMTPEDLMRAKTHNPITNTDESFRVTVEWLESRIAGWVQRTVAPVAAQVAALTEMVTRLADGQDVDVAAVQAAAEAGARTAIAEGVVKVDVSIKDGDV